MTTKTKTLPAAFVDYLADLLQIDDGENFRESIMDVGLEPSSPNLMWITLNNGGTLYISVDYEAPEAAVAEQRRGGR
jgi:hypothetical protein